MITREQSRYKIYTEDRNRDKIRAIVADYFDGFTMFSGVGIWENKIEKNLTIEIITGHTPDIIKAICKKINRLNSQDCCLVTVEPVEIAYV